MKINKLFVTQACEIIRAKPKNNLNLLVTLLAESQ